MSHWTLDLFTLSVPSCVAHKMFQTSFAVLHVEIWAIPHDIFEITLAINLTHSLNRWVHPLCYLTQLIFKIALVVFKVLNHYFFMSCFVHVAKVLSFNGVFGLSRFAIMILKICVSSAYINSIV